MKKTNKSKTGTKTTTTTKTGTAKTGNWVALIFEENSVTPIQNLSPQQTKAYNAIKKSAKEFAETVFEHLPTNSEPKINSLRLIRDAFFEAGTAVGTEAVV